MDEPLMNKEQLADWLGVPVGWVAEAITKRSIPITWIGKHARFDEDDRKAIVAAGKETPASPVVDLVHRAGRRVA